MQTVPVTLLVFAQGVDYKSSEAMGQDGVKAGAQGRTVPYTENIPAWYNICFE